LDEFLVGTSTLNCGMMQRLKNYSTSNWWSFMWFWSFCCNTPTRRQLTAATKRQCLHGWRNLQPTAKYVPY